NGNATPSTFTGVVQNGAGGGLLHLTVAGGSLALTGGASTYTGVTQVNGGTLTVAAMANGGAASSIGSSPSAATSLVLNGGTGIGGLGGGLFVSRAVIRSPGNPGIGTLSADPGITTWAPGGIYTVEYDSTAGLPFTHGTTIDLYNSNGTLNVTATSGNPFVI